MSTVRRITAAQRLKGSFKDTPPISTDSDLQAALRDLTPHDDIDLSQFLNQSPVLRQVGTKDHGRFQVYFPLRNRSSSTYTLTLTAVLASHSIYQQLKVLHYFHVR